MATIATSPGLPGPAGPTGRMHTAGIYSDMTVDGPEIGTLVVVFDRAKNLPNRKTMGKQDPYCAARLGKEAKKTETDKRGGQTPKWDQELRFTVHESPDYNNLKVSIFNDDKKTELIGETWINLEQVVVPGGGRNDTWHNLNYRGKYAGEVRVEMSYYDSRPKLEKAQRSRDSMTSGLDAGSNAGGQRQTPVKRRPLPTGPGGSTPSPAGTPDAARSFGPREPGSRTRGTSILSEQSSYTSSYVQPSQQRRPSPSHAASAPQFNQYDDAQHQNDLYHPRGDHGSYQQEEYPINTMQPDFLPQIPPKSSRNRSSLPYARNSPAPQGSPHTGRPISHVQLSHSHSAPIVATTHQPYPEEYPAEEDDYHPGMIPGPSSRMLQHRTDHIPGSFEDAYQHEPRQQRLPSRGSGQLEHANLPPLPPSHQSNAPAQAYHRPRASEPPSYISSASPLQSIERGYDQMPSHRHPVRAKSGDDYLASSASPGLSPTYAHSPARNQQLANRHSMSDSYGHAPSRNHPLSQEVRRSTSPQPYYNNDGYADEPREYHFPTEVSLIKPRAVSPQPARRSIASIQHPIQHHASRQSMSQESNNRLSNPTVPARKSVSPRASMNDTNVSRSSMPFSPDSFDTFNPSARESSHAAGPSPHSPYHVPNAPKGGSVKPQTSQTSSEPIVGWDGRVIDPSDHLPVDSWAPEPEQKTPSKTYGANTSRGGLAGPRSSQISPGMNGATGERRGNVIVNVRTKPRGTGVDDMHSDTASSAGGRNRLTKRAPGAGGRSPIDGPGTSPLREIDAPNPYAQQNYSGRFGTSGGGGGGEPAFDPRRSQGHSGSYAGSQAGYGHARDGYAQPDPRYDDRGGGGYGQGSNYGGGYAQEDYSYDHAGYDHVAGRGGGGGSAPSSYGAAPPPKPPKIPFEDRGFGPTALSKELANIDIGSSRRAPPPPAASAARGRGGRWG